MRWPLGVAAVVVLTATVLVAATGPFLRVHAQEVVTGSISGVVCDDRGRPLDFVNVVLLGTTMGAMSSNGGRFAIASVPPGEYTMRASFVGHDPGLRRVVVVVNRATFVNFCEDGEGPTQPPAIAALPDPSSGEFHVLDTSGGLATQLPLRNTRVRASIAGAVAHVVVEQTFANPYEQAIEAVYVFPLPHEAAVDAMTIRIGEREIRAQIRKRREAAQVYATARKEGRVAVLLVQERPNIFTQRVANIMPGHDVTVRIRYFEQLEFEGGYELVIPMVVGPRYIPGRPQARTAAPVSVRGWRGGDDDAPTGDQPKEDAPGAPTLRTGLPSTTGWSPNTNRVSDASRITPHVLAPGVDGGHRIDIHVDLDAGVPIEKIVSANHAVDVQRADARRATVRLRPTDTIPNKDFVLRYRVASDRVRFGFLAHRRRAGSGYFSLLATDNQVVSKDGMPTLAPQPVEMPQGVRHEGVFGRGGLARGVCGMAQTVTVTSEAKRVDLKSSDVSHVTGRFAGASPPETNEPVRFPGALHVRGGRSNDVQITIADTWTTARDISVTVKLDSSRVRLGGRVRMQIIVENLAPYAVQVPEGLRIDDGSVQVMVKLDGYWIQNPGLRVVSPWQRWHCNPASVAPTRSGSTTPVSSRSRHLRDSRHARGQPSTRRRDDRRNAHGLLTQRARRHPRLHSFLHKRPLDCRPPRGQGGDAPPERGGDTWLRRAPHAASDPRVDHALTGGTYQASAEGGAGRDLDATTIPIGSDPILGCSHPRPDALPGLRSATTRRSPRHRALPHGIQSRSRCRRPCRQASCR
jgi:hypothetical protein